MLIRMTNPKHGAMHVYSEADAVTHEKWGWVRELPAAPTPEPVVQQEEAQPVAEPTKRKYVRKGA